MEQPQTATPTAQPAGKGITLSDAAVARIQQLMADQNAPDGGLRLGVKGGGCSGLSYIMEWANAPKPKERVFTRDGARVFVDMRSLLILGGSELHFESTFMSATFKVRNPQAKQTCGCGESFSVGG